MNEVLRNPRIARREDNEVSPGILPRRVRFQGIITCDSDRYYQISNRMSIFGHFHHLAICNMGALTLTLRCQASNLPKLNFNVQLPLHHSTILHLPAS
jgi:hypothetical protein